MRPAGPTVLRDDPAAEAEAHREHVAEAARWRRKAARADKLHLAALRKHHPEHAPK